eukprot:01693.XXX_6555_5071_1 [CDS] Oithona nana genome sequencing.
MVTEEGNRLIIGGQDGSVTFLVVAHNSLEQRETTRNALRKLPSRKWQKRHHPGSLEEEPDKEGSQDDPSSSHLLSRELEERRLYKQRVLRRFRAIVRVTMLMDRAIQIRGGNRKKSKKSNVCSLS